MARFTLPVLGMAGAITVLGFGAFGDLTAWRADLPAMLAQYSGAAPWPARPAPLPAVATMAAPSPPSIPAPNPAPPVAPVTIAAPSPVAIPAPIAAPSPVA